MTPHKPSYPGYVYLIGSTMFGWFKIGKSVRPEIRINDIGILLPFKIELIALWGTANHSYLETALHERWKENRINGEWFKLSLSNIMEIVSEYPPYPGDRIFGAVPGNPPLPIKSSLKERKESHAKFNTYFTGGAQKFALFRAKLIADMEASGLEPTKENKKMIKAKLKAKIDHLWRASHAEFEAALMDE